MWSGLPQWHSLLATPVATPRLRAMAWAFYAFLIFTAIQLSLGVIELYWISGETIWETKQSRLRVFLAANIFCWVIDFIGRQLLSPRGALPLLRISVVCAVAYLATWAGVLQLGTDSHVATLGVFSGVLLTLYRSPLAGNLQLLLCLCVTLLALHQRGDISIALSNLISDERPLGFALFASFLQPYMIGLIINVSLGRLGAAYEWAVGKQRVLAAEKERLANTDPLTGVRSRTTLERDFNHLLGKASDAGGRLLIMIFDLDNFKHINTFSGHVAGDAVLKHFAQKLMTDLPQAEIYRLGGDEFLGLRVLETEEDLPKFELESLSSEMHVHYLNDDISLTVSIGFCLTEPGESLGSAISRADEAIREVKRSGKSQARAYSEKTSLPKASSRVFTGRSVAAQAGNQAARSISARQVGDAIFDGSISYYLQPILNSKTGERYGVEALLRWHTSQGTLVPLDDYLATFVSLEWQPPFLEYMAKMRLALKERVLEQLAVPIHFNFSMEALGLETYADRISNVLSSDPESASGLVIEVSEKELFSRQPSDYNRDQAREHLINSRRAGAKLALDDFGAELNNFDRLQELQVDMIKIDARFIRSLESDKVNQILVGNMKHLADDLAITLIAEGVETQDQQRVLLDLGIDLHQGWLVGDAVAPEQLFAEALTSHMP